MIVNKKIQIKTFGDLKKLIEKYDLENTEIVVGTEGYMSSFETLEGLQNGEVYIQKLNNKQTIICDSCNYELEGNE